MEIEVILRAYFAIGRVLHLFLENLKFSTLIEYHWFCSFYRSCKGRGLGESENSYFCFVNIFELVIWALCSSCFSCELVIAKKLLRLSLYEDLREFWLRIVCRFLSVFGGKVSAVLFILIVIGGIEVC